MRAILLFTLAILAVTGIAVAPQVTPAVPLITETPTNAVAATQPPNIEPTTPEIPPVALFTVTPSAPELVGTPSLRPITLDPNDARLAVCAASTFEGFSPYVVRPGDRLDLLLAGVDSITATQLAALNCLDDPSELPIGAVIWLPQNASLFALPTPLPDEPLSDTALITDFEGIAQDNASGATITWAAEGETAYLYPCGDLNTCQRPQYAAPISLNGSLTISPFRYPGEYFYRLEVTAGEETISRDVTFMITCAQEWIGAMDLRYCPISPPIAVMIAYQPFEHGAMIWFSDTLEIYVLTDDGRVSVFEDVFREGAPDPAAQAPEGRLTPVRGFGMIWEFLGGTASPLGWATAQEGGFDSARQAAGRISYTTYILAPENAAYAITLIPGQEVGYWIEIE